jgi:sn-glycerol 3-phosphate transport system permease protein
LNASAVFKNRSLPYLLIAPQIAVTLAFFIWPAAMAVFQSLLREDPFGLATEFIGLANYVDVLEDPRYLDTVIRSCVLAVVVTAGAMATALVLATMADGVGRGSGVYKTLLIWPYAVAPALAGVLWFLIFNPSIGVVGRGLNRLGVVWNPALDGTQAFVLIVVAAAWKQISYNFVFFLAGLQTIPRAVIEAAAIDGAGPGRRFFTIVLPLLGPTTFFLLVVNLVYAFFETFAVIHATTRGGPNSATETLVFKVFNDGFVGLDLGGSAAQSVILMALVGGLTALQFHFLDRKGAR